MIRWKWYTLILLLSVLFQTHTRAETSGIRETFRFLGNETPVCFEMKTEFGKIAHFDDNRTEQLNRLLRHITFSGVLNKNEVSMTVSLDQKELFSVFQTEKDGKEKMVLFAGNDSFCVIPEEEMPVQTKSTPFYDIVMTAVEQKEIYCTLDTFMSFFGQIRSFFQEKCGSATILEKYKDYGTAVKKINLRLNSEEIKEFFMNHLEGTVYNHYGPDLKKIQFSGRQDFEFLVTEEEKEIKIRYGGTAGYSDEDMRTVRIEWKTVRNDTVEKDELSIRTPSQDANRRNNLLLEHLWRKTERHLHLPAHLGWGSPPEPRHGLMRWMRN